MFNLHKDFTALPGVRAQRGAKREGPCLGEAAPFSFFLCEQKKSHPVGFKTIILLIDGQTVMNWTVQSGQCEQASHSYTHWRLFLTPFLLRSGSVKHHWHEIYSFVESLAEKFIRYIPSPFKCLFVFFLSMLEWWWWDFTSFKSSI